MLTHNRATEYIHYSLTFLTKPRTTVTCPKHCIDITTDVPLNISMFWKTFDKTCVEEPLGSLFPNIPDYPSKQWRLWGPGTRLWCWDNSVESQTGGMDYLQRVSLCSRIPGGLSPVIYESEWIKQKFSPGRTKSILQLVCYFLQNITCEKSITVIQATCIYIHTYIL